MTRFYGLDEANAQLGELEPILVALRSQRVELVRLRDEVLELGGGSSDITSSTLPSSGRPERATAPERNLRLVRLRMQGLIDQMQAGVGQLVERDVTLREIETGLIDFPALANGRQVWLCWRLGEGPIDWWHELGDGFGGRRQLIDLT